MNYFKRARTVSDFLVLLGEISEAQRLSEKNGLMELRVVWNPRLTTTGGRFHPTGSRGGRRIDLNPTLMVEGEAAVRATFLHELAHAIVRTEGYIGPSHGRVWQRCARAIGCSAKRTHNHGALLAKRVRRGRMPRQVVGVCELCDYKMERARPITGTYRHKGCKGIIRAVTRLPWE